MKNMNESDSKQRMEETNKECKGGMNSGMPKNCK
jgi:hypothetical protein